MLEAETNGSTSALPSFEMDAGNPVDQNDAKLLIEALYSTDELYKKKFVPFSQKAAIIKLNEISLPTAEASSIEKRHIDEAHKILDQIKDAQLSALANLGILSALVGCATFSMLLTPFAAVSLFEGSTGDKSDLMRLYVMCCGTSAAFSCLAICMATWFTLVITALLPKYHDLVWFVVNVPAVMMTAVATTLGVLLLLVTLSVALFIIYSARTARHTIFIAGAVLSLYLIVFGVVAIPVFKKINGNFSVRKVRSTPI
jgi:hypothetical protein